MDYQVGQILYMCDENKMKIIPLQVVEEITRTSLDNGKEKNYIVMFPDSKKTKINLNNITHKIFQDIDEVEKTMIKNASEAIKKMRNAAELLSQKEFKVPENTDKTQNQNEKRVQVETNNDIITVDLGDGTKAKMNTSLLEKVINQ
tara:strand:- start:62 stop:499 length:438 start_codon:yes stop_codon:yes gene_type:complete